MYFQFLDYNRQIDSWRQASPKLLWVERWPSHFHFLWIWECVVYSSSWLGGALKVILFCDYSKNLEAERSAPISCHFPFDSWRQSKNQKEIIVYHQRQRNQDTDKTIFICFLIQAGRNKYPGLIKKWRRCLLLFQAIKNWRGILFCFYRKIWLIGIIKIWFVIAPLPKIRKERLKSPFLVVSPTWAMSINRSPVWWFSVQNKVICLISNIWGTFLVAQWLRHQVSTARGTGSNAWFGN